MAVDLIPMVDDLRRLVVNQYSTEHSDLIIVLKMKMVAEYIGSFSSISKCSRKYICLTIVLIHTDTILFAIAAFTGLKPRTLLLMLESP